MDIKFLKEVQEKGWAIQKVTKDSVIAKCPSAGCNLYAEMMKGGYVPEVDPGCRRDPIDMPMLKFNDIREKLRERREDLGLIIKDVEAISGIEDDHIAKMELDQTKRLPNIQTLIYWAGALGFELVLRPAPMTATAIRTIVETRDKLGTRSKRTELERNRRRERARRQP